MSLLRIFKVSQWSLVQKLLVGINLASILLMTGYAGTTLYTSYKEGSANIDGRADSYARLLALASAQYIWNMDNASLDSICKELEHRDDLEFVLFFDNDGKQLTSAKPEKPAYPIYNVSREIVDSKGAKIGRLDLVYNKQRLMENFKESAIRNVFNILIVQLVLSLLSFLIVRAVTGKVTRSLELLRGSASTTKICSDDVHGASDTLNMSVAEQASAIQETVSTLAQISEMVTKSTESVGRSSEKAQECQKFASAGRNAVSEVVKSMDEIDKNNDQTLSQVAAGTERLIDVVGIIKNISEQTKVINDIVFQTKLLSFNASVEAARAGEHGKGFAVVAEEVGNLAQMSGKAAKDIESHLSQSIHRVEEIVSENRRLVDVALQTSRRTAESGVVVARRCDEVFSKVFEAVEQVNQLMTEIARASQEQEHGVRNITSAMGLIDASTQKNSATAVDTADYSKRLAQEANVLQDTVETLEAAIHGSKGDEASAHDWESGGSQSFNAPETHSSRAA